MKGYFDYFNKTSGSCRVYLRKGKHAQVLRAALLPMFTHVALNRRGQKLCVATCRHFSEMKGLGMDSITWHTVSLENASKLLLKEI